MYQTIYIQEVNYTLTYANTHLCRTITQATLLNNDQVMNWMDSSDPIQNNEQHDSNEN